jgi:hypothetical protein
MVRLGRAFWICTGLLAASLACGRLPFLSGPVTRLATQTPPQQAQPTAALPAIEATSTAPGLPTSPAETDTAEAAARGKILPVSGLPAMAITSLRLAPGGEVWVGGSAGIYQLGEGEPSRVSKEPAAALLGGDAAGRMWAVFDNGASIGDFEASAWKMFGAKEGWKPVPEGVYLGPGPSEHLLTDSQGQVWWATGLGELRRFDPAQQRWTIFSAKDLGLPPADPDMQGYFFTDLATLKDGSLLASACGGAGESYLPVGVARLRDGKWMLISATAKDCVLSMQTSPQGTVWAGGFDALLEYCQECMSWERVSLPPFERRQLVLSVDLDSDGDPWVEVIHYSGASAFGEVARYALKGSRWLTVYGPAPYDRTALALGPGGANYLEAGGILYRVQDGKSVEITSLESGPGAYRLLVDRSGRLWIARLGEDKGGVWTYQP